MPYSSFNLISTARSNPTNPLFSEVISDYGIIFKTIKYKTPSIQGFLSEFLAQRIQDSV